MGSLAVFNSAAAAISIHPPHQNPNRHARNPNPRSSLVFLPRRRLQFRRITAAAAASAPADPREAPEMRPSRVSGPPPSRGPPRAAPVMKKGDGLGSVGAVTLEKPKLKTSSDSKKKPLPELATGGGGGDIGKKIGHGGGDGGDDDGDDDDYFDDFDDDDEGSETGLFRRRRVFQELFEKKFVDAVLQEWFKTMANLPAGLRLACEQGAVSSAQMVRYLAINARPTTSRFISRALPGSLSRAFIGRMIADPSFLYKMILESLVTLGSSVWWELKNRKERIKDEWDLALLNVLTVTACNSFVVWSLAPSRSYGNTFNSDLQNTFQKYPNNFFEKSYPMREFDLRKRVESVFYRTAHLCFVGSTAGYIQAGLSKLLSARKEGRLSVTIPSVSNNVLGYGAFLGLYANLRYQLLCGLDRALMNHFDVLGVPIFFSTALRVMNAYIGETSRLCWLGIEANPLAPSTSLLRAYNRPEGANMDQPESRWFISKNPVISGLGLLGMNGAASKPRRKRTVRKKVSTSSV